MNAKANKGMILVCTLVFITIAAWLVSSSVLAISQTQQLLTINKHNLNLDQQFNQTLGRLSKGLIKFVTWQQLIDDSIQLRYLSKSARYANNMVPACDALTASQWHMLERVNTEQSFSAYMLLTEVALKGKDSESPPVAIVMVKTCQSQLGVNYWLTAHRIYQVKPNTSFALQYERARVEEKTL